MIRSLTLAASAAALTAFAAPANAVALFSADAFAGFQAEYDPTDIVVVTDTFITDEGSSEAGTGAVTDLTPDQFEGFGFVSTSGSVAGSAAAPAGLAEAFLLTDGFISFENTGAEPVTLFYFWNISGDAGISLDDPATEDASAGAVSDIFAELSAPEVGSEIVLEVGDSAFADPSFLADFYEDFGDGEIVLAPGAILEVFLIADPDGFAEVVSDARIPLPAAAPLLLAGLGALGLARARRRR